MEAQAEDQSSSDGDRGTVNQEEPINEVDRETLGLLPGADEELTGPEQDMSEDLEEVNRVTVDGMEEEGVALGPSEEEAEEMTELESSSGEKEKTEGQSELDEMSVVVGPDEEEGEGDTGEEIEQRNTKELVRTEGVLAGEGGIVLEVDGKGDEELAGAEDKERDCADSEKGVGNINAKLIGTVEKDIETSGVEDLVGEEAEKGPGSEHRDTDGESEEDGTESAENQGEVGKLSEFQRGENLEETEEEQDAASAVDQEKAEESPGEDERKLPEVIVGGAAVSAEVEREQEELMGLAQEETQVLTEEGVGKSTVDQRENQVLVEASEEGPEVIGRKDLASEVDKTEEVSGADQMETENKTAEGEVTSKFSQRETEGLTRASQEQLEQVTGKEGVAPTVGQGEVERVLEDLREAEGGATPAVSQGGVEDLLAASQGKVDQVIGKEDVMPAVSQRQGGSLPEDQRKEERDVEGTKEARVGQREVEKAIRKEDVASLLVQVEAVKVRGVDEKKAEDVDLTMDQGKAGEDTAPVAESEVITEGDAVLAVVEGDSAEITEAVTGEVDMVLAVAPTETQEVTVGQEIILPVGLEEAVEIVELPKQEDVPRRHLEEISLRSDEGRIKEDVKSRMNQEKVEELTGPETRDLEDLERFDEVEGKPLGFAGIVAEEEIRKEQVASAKDQGEGQGFVVLYQNQIAEDTGETEKVLSQDRLDSVERKVTSQKEVLVWRPELGEDLAGPTQEIAGVGSAERISRDDLRRAKSGQEEAAVSAVVGWRTPELSGHTLRVTGEWGRPGSSTASSRLSQHATVGSQEQQRRGKGKRILGLAGLRQGPILAVHHGAAHSTRGRGGVLDHLAPGLIVTSLTAQTEQRGFIRQDRMQPGRRTLEQRETRSAEPGFHGARVKVGEGMVLMGYRIGREGMSCFAEADNRAVMFQHGAGLEAATLPQGPELEAATVQQGPALDETRKESSQTLAEPVKEEQDVKEQEVLGSNVADVAGQSPERTPLAWLGRPLSGGYAASRPTSGWTAGIGAGHGLALGPLYAGIKERIDMMVIGQGTTKSAGQSPEPPRLGVGRSMLGLASKPEDVHWLKKVLGSERLVAPLSVAGHGSGIKPESPSMKVEQRTSGLLTGRQQLKDWRDGVMGIAIKQYNAMRRAVWGEGPVGLHVKGMKVTGSVPTNSIRTSSILDQVEQKVRKLAQHVTSENMPRLEVEGRDD